MHFYQLSIFFKILEFYFYTMNMIMVRKFGHHIFFNFNLQKS